MEGCRNPNPNPHAGLIKTVADQLRPLHETSRRHASQIEEISAGINVLAELCVRVRVRVGLGSGSRLGSGLGLGLGLGLGINALAERCEAGSSQPHWHTWGMHMGMHVSMPIGMHLVMHQAPAASVCMQPQVYQPHSHSKPCRRARHVVIAALLRRTARHETRETCGICGIHRSAGSLIAVPVSHHTSPHCVRGAATGRAQHMVAIRIDRRVRWLSRRGRSV